MKKFSAVLLSIIFIFSAAIPVFAADGDTDYAITNPYANVDWTNYNRFKTELHCHTTGSDGADTLPESVEKHYELGYDILAISDHGITNYSWTEPSYTPVVKFAMMFRKGNLPVKALEKSGTAANGKSYTVTTVNGDDYYAQADGKTMLRVPFAIENNPTSFNNAHVNSFFADYGNGILGGTSDYETPISNIDRLGGISVINHPGEYTNARDEVLTSDAYNKADRHYKYDINKFENILNKYSTCIGIDVNSKGDSRTRFDRKLWDTMLTDMAPSGRNVFGIASSDAHNLNIINSGYVIALMPEKTSAALQNCLANGEFFAQSRYIGNVDELTAYAQGLSASADATAQKIGADMQEAVDAINSEIKENNKQGTIFSFEENAKCAYIDSIAVDDDDDTITLSGSDMLYVRWISDGRVIAEGNKIDLDECENIGSYVRAEIISEGAVTYTEPFLLKYDGMPSAAEIKAVDFGKPVSVICDTIIKIAGKLEPLFDMILKAIGIV